MEINNVNKSNQQHIGEANVPDQAEMKSTVSVRDNMEKVQDRIKNATNEDRYEFSAVSKDGDTLTLSEKTKNSENSRTKIEAADEKVVANSTKMTDASLAKCSSSKLRQLLQQGMISKQQYEKAMKKALK